MLLVPRYQLLKCECRDPKSLVNAGQRLPSEDPTDDPLAEKDHALLSAVGFRYEDGSEIDASQEGQTATEMQDADARAEETFESPSDVPPGITAPATQRLNRVRLRICCRRSSQPSRLGRM